MTLGQIIVYTSNVFAIMGLRSFFVLLTILLTAFRHLHYGLAFVLHLHRREDAAAALACISINVARRLLRYQPIGRAAWNSARTRVG